MLRYQDYAPGVVEKTWWTYKRPLISDIPTTSPAMRDREREELQVMIFHSKKRPLLRKWPTGSSLPS